MESQNILLEKKQWVRLTKVCNDNCVFCLDKDNLNGTLIPLHEIASLLSRGIKQGAKRAVLSGGEPTLHPDFHTIVREARKLGYQKVQTVTNGRMFAYMGFLNDALDAGLTEITFSIPSHKREDHDALTQMDGSYLQTLAGLKNALQNGNVVVNIDIVVTKTNVPYLPEMIVFFKNMGVSEFDVLYPRPFGAAWDNKEDVFFAEDEAFSSLQQVFAMSRRNDIRIWANKFPEKYIKNFPELKTKDEKIWDELRAREEFAHFQETGEPMWCFGERCGRCFFKPTCHGIVKNGDGSHFRPMTGGQRQKNEGQIKILENETRPQKEETAWIPI